MNDRTLFDYLDPMDPFIDEIIREYVIYKGEKEKEMRHMASEKLKILITGSFGFVGTATKQYIQKQADVEIIDFDLMNKRDIRDWKQVMHIFNEYAPDRVLHLAAIARFAEADADPLLAHETNVLGTINVVNACKALHIPLVYASTGSAIMPLNDYEPPYTESIPARGNSVYGSTKAMGEYYVRQHSPHIVLRYAHLYGKEKRHHGLIGGFLSRINFGMKPVLYGGQQSNDFCYIDDVAQANWLALSAPWDKFNQTYHIGSGEELSAEEAGQMVCDVAGYKGDIEIREQRTVDPSRFVFDISKAKTMLGYEPKFTFKQGLEAMFK